MATSLEKRVSEIEDRNRRVELDKAWETSLTRRISITVLTYAVISSYLIFINNEQPFINALVPATGYIISTLIIKSVRGMWQRRRRDV